MAANEIHVADIGTVFKATIRDGFQKLDISGATTKDFLVEKPDASTTTWTGAFYTDGTDSILIFTTTIAGDLDQSGDWQIQAHLVLPTGTWRSDVYTFTVYANLI